MPEPDENRQARGVRFWWLLAVLVIAGHLLALYLPGSPEGPDLAGSDKLAHVALFAVPVWLLGRLTERIWLVAGGFTVHAVASEFVQWWFVPYREGSWGDLVADLAGIALAVALLLWRRNRIRR